MAQPNKDSAFSMANLSQISISPAPVKVELGMQHTF